MAPKINSCQCHPPGPYNRQLLNRLGVTESQLPELRQRVESFLTEEHFEEAAGLGLVTVLSGLAEAIEEDNGLVKKNWRIRHAENLDDMTITETCLQAGREVCALGKWNATRLGLYPPVELIAGDYDNARKILIANKRSNAVFGLLFAVLLSGMFLAFAWLAPPIGQ